MKKEKLRLRLICSGACLALALTLAVTGTFAWLSKEQAVDDAYVALSDLEVEGLLSFKGVAAQTGSSILIPVSLTSGGENYVGDMKYVIRYTGVSPAYLRVRVLEQWVNMQTDEIMSMNFLRYALSKEVRAVAQGDNKTIPAAGSGSGALATEGDWVDNRDQDYCYYYSVPAQPKALTTPKDGAVALGDGAVELTLIDQTQEGADTAGMLEGIEPTAQLMLLVEVEAIQPNRYREFWHMDTLPDGVG